MANSERICSVEGCDKLAAHHRTLCSSHYHRKQRYGDPTHIEKYRKTCTVPGCGQPAHGNGFCHPHYGRWKRHGDPLAGGNSRKEIRDWLHAHRDFAETECLPWPFLRSDKGYGVHKAPGIGGSAHQYMCHLVHGPRPSPLHEVRHLCGKGHEGCVNPTHLKWGTKKENSADRHVHGTWFEGERHPMAKITDADVDEIHMLSGYLSQEKIGAMFGLTQVRISQILRGRWKRTSH